MTGQIRLLQPPPDLHRLHDRLWFLPCCSLSLPTTQQPHIPRESSPDRLHHTSPLLVRQFRMPPQMLQQLDRPRERHPVETAHVGQPHADRLALPVLLVPRQIQPDALRMVRIIPQLAHLLNQRRRVQILLPVLHTHRHPRLRDHMLQRERRLRLRHSCSRITRSPAIPGTFVPFLVLNSPFVRKS